jgi:hypothetical protein
MSLRILLVGDSGTGKTGSLLPLLQAGYDIHLADFDSGADFLRLRAPGLKGALRVKTFTDKFTRIGDSLTCREPMAVSQFYKALERWDEHGAISKWPPTTIFVLDSLSFFSRAEAYRYQKLNNKLGKEIEAREYGPIQQSVMRFLDTLLTDDIKASIIINTHLDYREVREGTLLNVGMMERGTGPEQVRPSETDLKALPLAFGAKLGGQIGRYFNFMLQTKTRVIGKSVKRYFLTQPDGIVDAKCPIPDIPRELDFEPGLATLFTKWKEAGL